jgi:hypothetical protein
MEEWNDGKMEERKNGRLEEWKSARMEEFTTETRRTRRWKEMPTGDWRLLLRFALCARPSATQTSKYINNENI